jgi:uncharacterized protein DUF4157/DNA/RNA non-specific endonuclease
MYENKVKTPDQKTAGSLSESKQEAGDGVVASAPHHNIVNIQRKANKTGLPDKLKSGIEHLSGHSMDDVKVHFNSSKPAQLQAHAYAQGTAIHIGPGQERHLPHEAWHVVQQKQGRVRPTLQMKGRVKVNDDAGLEREADVMGVRAFNAPEALRESDDGKQPVRRTARKNDCDPNTRSIQMSPKVATIKSTKKTYIRVARDVPSKFKGGKKAGKYGIGDVDKYRGWYAAANTLNKIGGKTGKIRYEKSNWMNNVIPEYANGHLIPKSMGGRGNKNNVFEQESGQNSGSWTSFEKKAKKELERTPHDEKFEYGVELQGNNLEYT